MTNSSTFRATDFVNDIGVDTHIPYTDGGYVNIANVVADLKYIGVNQVRDGLSNGEYGSAPLSSFVSLAQQGVQFTLIVGGSLTTATLQAKLALIDALNTAVPGSVVAVEGTNEINNQPITFNGVGGQQGAIDLQQAIYASVHADPKLVGVSVDYFTGYGVDGYGPDPAVTPGLADYDTQHPYPRFGQAPATWIAPATVLSNEYGSPGPAVYTETGYSTYGAGGDTVSPDVQAKYILDLLFDAAKDGISRTYLYQLMDAYAPGSPQGDDGYGLFDPSGAPKPAATALHNLTAILSDSGAADTTFTPTPLAYTLTGLPSTGNSLEIQKSDGTTDIAVWAEPQIWDQSSQTEIAAPTVAATVNLGAYYRTVTVYDPLNSAAPIATYNNVASVQLALTDHPLIVSVGGASDLVSATKPTVDDFTGDHTSDILWQNQQSGAVYDWGMQNGQQTSNNLLGAISPSQCKLIGTGDFNGDGASDLLWQNQQSGAIYDWSGGQQANATLLGNLSASQWKLIGTGDFTGDGVSDLLWQNQQSGAIYQWGMQNGQHVTDTFLGSRSPSQWSLVATGDFNGDGVSDLLWQNQQTGALYEWGMQNGQQSSSTFLGSLAPKSWKLLGTGDFNGDGSTDLLWQNQQTGAVYEWGMKNGQHATDIFLGDLSPAQWHLLGTGDYNGDGASDLLWQNQQTGAVYEWGMQNGQHVTSVMLGKQPLSAWSPLTAVQ